MLNIKFTLNGGGGLARDIWHMTGSHCIHSQELLLLALLLVLLATGILNNLPGWTSCHCDNIRLVSWAENYVSYMTVQGIPILSLLIFMPSLYSHSILHLLVV